jgi:hypothetical protein
MIRASGAPLWLNSGVTVTCLELLEPVEILNMVYTMYIPYIYHVYTMYIPRASIYMVYTMYIHWILKFNFLEFICILML